MYLVSLYFDEKTNQRLEKYIQQVAKRTGNIFMTEGNVPPHITVGAFESKLPQDELVRILQPVFADLYSDLVHLVSVGTFQTSSIYLSAVYSAYLHEVCKSVNEVLENVENTVLRKNYQPFNWLPHVTIGKTLTKEQQRAAFAELQESFGMIEAKAVDVGLSRTNPYRDILRVPLRSIK